MSKVLSKQNTGTKFDVMFAFYLDFIGAFGDHTRFITAHQMLQCKRCCILVWS